MGWKGTVRSVNSSLNRMAREAERDAKRRQRELERMEKEQAKMDALEQAAYEVEAFDNLMDRLTSLHNEYVETFDWEYISTEVEPTEPVKKTHNERKAQAAFENYKPSLIDRIFGKQATKISMLQTDIERSASLDKSVFEKELLSFQNNHAKWKTRCDFANRILNGDYQAFNEAVLEIDLFSEIKEFGIQSDIHFKNSEQAQISLNIHGEDIIPSEKKLLLQSGRLSVKKMPKGEFYEYFQDHVCSSAISVANETFAAFPSINEITVDVMDKMLNTSNGYIEDAIILSVMIPRKTLETLNLEAIDASDSMKNFNHSMSFKKTIGFSAVDPL
jgi:hypothetical protein